MNIETKFNHGDRVQAITNGTKEITNICEFCEGSGTIYYKGENIECPKCFGSGFFTSFEAYKWFVSLDDYYNFTIQRIGVELYNPNNKKWKNKRSWIYYMSAESGTMFDENDCFSSVKEAQEECDKRNQ